MERKSSPKKLESLASIRSNYEEAAMGLEGTWYSELGSMLDIAQISDGTLVGTYETAVSNGCAQGKFALIGRTDVESGGDTVGFAVTWKNDQSSCNSTTSWAGQYQIVDGQEYLTAFWLLARESDAEEQWASTLVGEDVFTRQTVNAERQGEVAAYKRRPHP
jgi:Avidin family